MSENTVNTTGEVDMNTQSGVKTLREEFEGLYAGIFDLQKSGDAYLSPVTQAAAIAWFDAWVSFTTVEHAAGALQLNCHGAAKRAGWWQHPATGEPVQNNPYCFSNKLMLIVSEVSEAMEGDRKNLMDDKLPHRPMREVELADAVIRIFDLAGAYDMDLGGAIQEKLAFNAQRPDHKLATRQAAGGKAY
ncbi:hypothetical protein [Comamonas fluminis]|uniref:hypothetical protein n=1 Tax=Comamonas fluminis TaxID=2796366 RepID=UPI001FE7BF0B|nr:hypothetical protein [Comamonas fluminis]